MVVTTLNDSQSQTNNHILLSQHMHAFSDVDILVGQKHFSAHRAVLAVHSLHFRDIFSTQPNHTISSANSSDSNTINISPSSSNVTPVTPPVSSLVNNNNKQQHENDHENENQSTKPTRYLIHISNDHQDNVSLRTGWQLIFNYIYGASVQLDTETALAALPLCRKYRFDELSTILDAYLCEGAVTPINCTKVYAAASIKISSLSVATTPSSSTSTSSLSPSSSKRIDSDTQLVLSTAWNMMKTRFDEIENWSSLSHTTLVKLLKLNDLNVKSESSVFDGIVNWINGNQQDIDQDIVASLVKLVRFPTMSQIELEKAISSDLVKSFPVCKKYISRGLAARADEKRGLVRSILMESSPVYRKRRTDALTFADRVSQWSRIDRIDHCVYTSSRYFAGCLWNLIIDPGKEWVALHLECKAENDDRRVDVELDFSIFIVRHTGSEPELITKQVKGACFSKSGQRIGFKQMIKREEIEKDNSRLLLRDSLFIGASIRLRSSKLQVIGITEDADDIGESECTMT